MSVKILQNVRAISDERGVQPLTTYKAGDTFPTDEPWQRAIADNLIRGGMAEETKVCHLAKQRLLSLRGLETPMAL